MVALQPNMQVHDDLAALFSRNLTFSNQNYDFSVQQHVASPSPAELAPQLAQESNSPAPTNTINNDVTEQQQQQPNTPTSPIIYSISQHYHHSSHIVARSSTTQPGPGPEAEAAQQQQQPARRPSSEPRTDAIETLLAAHGVDATALTLPQLQLFRIADDAQKLRLMELWRICPPEKNTSMTPNTERAGVDNPTLAWSSTSLEREEMLAQMRFEQRQAEEIQAQLLAEAAAAEGGADSVMMSLDGTAVQVPDGRWVPYEHMEPYMLSGYEELMRREAERRDEEARRRMVQEQVAAAYTYRPAVDPVYRDAGGVGSLQWQMQMENQYGAFEQFRTHAAAGTVDAMEIL